jgi:hypothetical protein
VLIVAFAPSARAQSEDSDSPRPVPVLNVGAGFITTFNGGDAHLGPLLSPVLLIPIGDRWLIEIVADGSDHAPAR